MWYLPAQGVWYYVDRLNEFRVQTPDEFEAGFSVLILAINAGLFASALFLIRRGLGSRSRAAAAGAAGA